MTILFLFLTVPVETEVSTRPGGRKTRLTYPDGTMFGARKRGVLMEWMGEGMRTATRIMSPEGIWREEMGTGMSCPWLGSGFLIDSTRYRLSRFGRICSLM